MKTRQLTIIIFLNKDGALLLQDRRSINKKGAAYGFFGGHIEEGETPHQALRRELKEELELDISNTSVIFFKHEKKLIQSIQEEREYFVFLSPIPQIKGLKIHEGEIHLTTIQESASLDLSNQDKIFIQEAADYVRTK